VGTKGVGRVEAGRFDVRSADGTSIAVWVEGDGPALVMVHGAIADRTTFEPFVAVLRHEMTTVSMDRRGFGASGDTLAYAIERDFEDVAAVIDAVAALTGGPVAVWGHSYGANCAMGGAALTGNVHTSSGTNRASASHTRRAPSNASRARLPGAIMTPPSPPCSSKFSR
jgi:pimeloyl-ACP methyl ester carboxylesterase